MQKRQDQCAICWFGARTEDRYLDHETTHQNFFIPQFKEQQANNPGLPGKWPLKRQIHSSEASHFYFCVEASDDSKNYIYKCHASRYATHNSDVLTVNNTLHQPPAITNNQ